MEPHRGKSRNTNTGTNPKVATSAVRKKFKTLNPLAVLQIPAAVLRPITSQIPSSVRRQLRDPAAREKLVDKIDRALVSAEPRARALDEDFRREVIGLVVGLVIDRMILGR